MDVKIANSGFNNFGLGMLTIKESGAEVFYQPYEVSRYSIGVVSYDGLESGTDLILHSSEGAIPLMISEKIENSVAYGMARYHLKCSAFSFDLEKIFKKSAGAKTFNAMTQYNPIQNARFEIFPTISMKAKTFGTRTTHEMSTVNISRSGMLVSSTDQGSYVPFINNTLIEIQIQKDGQWIKEPVRCLGKVVRCLEYEAGENQKVKQFGVKIIDIDPQDEAVWEIALRAIENDLAFKSKSQEVEVSLPPRFHS